ncbi:MAG TPA: ABC transporter permease [Rhodanobacteraceae bacterium]
MNALRMLRVLLGGAAAWRRGGFLVVTVAVATAVWLVLSAMTAPFTGNVETQGKNSMVAVLNANGAMGGMPITYAHRIEKIPGARDVAWSTMQIVLCKTSPTVVLPLVGLGGPGVAYGLTHGQVIVDAATLEKWQKDPLGIIVTSKALAACGVKVGQSIEPKVMRGAKHIAVHVIGSVKNKRSMAFAHFDYINRMGSFIGKDKVLGITARADQVRDNERLAAKIQNAFAHDYPTVKATTSAKLQNALARFGKVQQLLMFVMAAALLCAASVLVSVFAHASAQRRPRFAVLRVLGFKRGTLFGAVVLEGLLIVLVGAAIGIGIGLLTAHLVGQSTVLGQILAGHLSPPSWAWAWLPAWLAALWIVAMLIPARAIRRVRASDYRAG